MHGTLKDPRLPTLELLTQFFKNSILQLAVVFLISAIIYGIATKLQKKTTRTSFADFLGLRKPRGQVDLTFFYILIAAALFAATSAAIPFYFSPTLRGFLLSEASPYGRILKGGFGVSSLLSALLYCFVQSAGAEEVLFRGLIGRRLFKRLNFRIGNIIQASIFWIMHLLIFRMALGSWISWIQLYAFAVSMGLGLVSGYVNHRKGGQSIVPSWIIHSTVNLISFLTLAFLVS